jgi:DNA-binding MarR family transcriptional regulator
MSTTEAASRDTDLMFLLSCAHHALLSEQRAGLAPLDITPRDRWLLDRARDGDMTQRDLAAACGLDKTTMVAVVDRLEDAGLVERRPSAADRRAWLISVTEKGRRLVTRANRIVERIHADALAGLSPELRKGLIGGLEHLANGGTSVRT